MAATKIFEGGPATKNSFNKKRAVRGRAPRFFAYASSLHPFPLTLLLCFIACRIHLLFFFSSSSSTGIPGGDFPGLAKTGKQSINS